MSEAYVSDLCVQLNDLASLAGKTACVRTRSGKVQVDHSLSGLMWRKLINSEDESRGSTVAGIESLLSTANDYVASTLKMTPIVRNVTVALKEKGKVVELSTSPKKQVVVADVAQEKQKTEEVELTQEQFFKDCSAQTVAGLKSLAVAERNSCKGIADLLSRRYNHDFEIVALLLDEINYADLIATRIEEATKEMEQ